MVPLSKIFDGSHVYGFTPQHLHTVTLRVQQHTKLQLRCVKPCAFNKLWKYQAKKKRPETKIGNWKTQGSSGRVTTYLSLPSQSGCPSIIMNGTTFTDKSIPACYSATII